MRTKAKIDRQDRLGLENANPQRVTKALTEDAFRSMLILERRRAERSRKPFVLMLLDSTAANGSSLPSLQKAFSALSSATRETDIIGWYKQAVTLGVVFTELGLREHNGVVVTNSLRAKVQNALEQHIGRGAAAKFTITLHVFPECLDGQKSTWQADSNLYPEFQPDAGQKKISLGIKRALDIVASAAALLVLAPILAVVAILIKFTSEGPVLFSQERLGLMGKSFKCLKFRTMRTNCDPSIHQDYVQKFIAGQAGTNGTSGSPAPVYKIVRDPRITPIGCLLRKTSLDEIPQLWNVLIGEMSLVGPRPPIRYEFDVYDIWHRRRVLEVRPGITGLWQVNGRSRTQFDDMVRLDLQYIRRWSLWLDLKILAATPKAVFSGDGAY